MPGGFPALKAGSFACRIAANIRVSFFRFIRIVFSLTAGVSVLIAQI